MDMQDLKTLLAKARKSIESDGDYKQPIAPPPRFQCEVCDDMGYVVRNVPSSHDDFGKSFLCPSPTCGAANQIRARQVAKYFSYSDWPEGFTEIAVGIEDKPLDEAIAMLWEPWNKLDDYSIQHKRKAVRAAGTAYTAKGAPFATAESAGRLAMGLGLLGTYGTGKSWLLATVACSLMAAQVPVVYLRTASLIKAVQATYGKNANENTLDVIKAAQDAPVLFLDEFSLNSYTADKLDIIETILDRRHNLQRPYFLAANFNNLDELGEHWGKWFSSRVAKDLHWYYMQGISLRSGGQIYS